MDETFYSALLRISIAQILKASGFDKCKPTVLNIITDIYTRKFEHILSVAKNFALERSSCTNDITGADVLEALLSVGLLKSDASDWGPDRSDSSTNTKSLESFLNWLKYSNIYSVSKKLSTVPAPLLYNLMEKRKIDTSAETDQERKKRRLRERQEFYNQLKQTDEAAPDHPNGLTDDLEDEELSTNDKLSWLAYLAEKDLKLGHNMKFLNSCIQDDIMAVHKNTRYHPTPPDGENSYAFFKSQAEKSIKSDHIVISSHEPADPKDGAKESVVEPSPEIASALPYNIKYSEVLLQDDLSQYIGYAERHEDEISERLAAIPAHIDTPVEGSGTPQHPAEMGVPPDDAEQSEGLSEVAGVRSQVQPETKDGDTSQKNISECDADSQPVDLQSQEKRPISSIEDKEHEEGSKEQSKHDDRESKEGIENLENQNDEIVGGKEDQDQADQDQEDQDQEEQDQADQEQEDQDQGDQDQEDQDQEDQDQEDQDQEDQDQEDPKDKKVKSI